MRYQVLVLDSEIKELTAGTEITKFQMLAARACSGDEFYNLEVKLCHSEKSILSTTPDDNYSGNTPKVLHANPTFRANFSKDEWYGFELEPPFKYNGSSGLIFEIIYQGNNDGDIMSYFDSDRGRTLEARTLTGAGSLQGMQPIRIHYKDNTGFIKQIQMHPINQVKVYCKSSPGLITIHLRLNEQSKVSIDVFDTKGSCVKSILSNTNMVKGYHTLQWDCTSISGTPVSQGIYYSQFMINTQPVAKKIIVKTNQ